MAALVLSAPLALGLHLHRSRRPLDDRWRTLPVEPPGPTHLGLTFRPRQAEALGLDPPTTLRALLPRPFPLIRLGAYWNRVEPRPGIVDHRELDWQVEAAEQAGKQIVLCLGAIKTFGYPEQFVPAHRLGAGLPEGRLIAPSDRPDLLAAATEQLARVVERYRASAAIVAWQVEHEPVDPLGFEHSWRLSAAFVEREVAAVRRADPSRPILLNGFLPATPLAALAQWWRTRDQGDSLELAGRLADIVGVDDYPRTALTSLGGLGLYLEGGRWAARHRIRLLAGAAAAGRRLIVTEGQAEPWEATTTPPSWPGAAAPSCPPDQLIANYNSWRRAARAAALPFDAYLFWGAEYWLLRERAGDRRYLAAFERVLAA